MIASINQTFLSRDPRFSLAAVFHSGQEALEWLRKRPVELLILDVYMPRMSGLELLRELEQVKLQMKAQPLPAHRQEFESRALLYLSLLELEQFLVLKREFAMGLSREEIRRFWGGG